jgi:DNA invertase Pin-like site-specific DNA recombinase
MGKAMFAVIAAMAELERSLIQERVVDGLHYASENGTKSGNSVGRPRKIFRRDTVLELRSQGLSWREISRRVHAGITTARRAVREGRTNGGLIGGTSMKR